MTKEQELLLGTIKQMGEEATDAALITLSLIHACLCDMDKRCREPIITEACQKLKQMSCYLSQREVRDEAAFESAYQQATRAEQLAEDLKGDL